jgi:hypothetical protein
VVSALKSGATSPKRNAMIGTPFSLEVRWTKLLQGRIELTRIVFA